ncbi:hypothetical protein ACFL5V_10720 [Fibrobacterota bacterium]
MLKDTLLGFFLLPYGRSVRKKIVRHPKFHFFDPGVVSFFTRQLSVPFAGREGCPVDYGRSFEHFFMC